LVMMVDEVVVPIFTVWGLLLRKLFIQWMRRGVTTKNTCINL